MTSCQPPVTAHPHRHTVNNIPDEMDQLIHQYMHIHQADMTALISNTLNSSLPHRGLLNPSQSRLVKVVNILYLKKNENI